MQVGPGLFYVLEVDAAAAVERCSILGGPLESRLIQNALQPQKKMVMGQTPVLTCVGSAGETLLKKRAFFAIALVELLKGYVACTPAGFTVLHHTDSQVVCFALYHSRKKHVIDQIRNSRPIGIHTASIRWVDTQALQRYTLLAEEKLCCKFLGKL